MKYPGRLIYGTTDSQAFVKNGVDPEHHDGDEYDMAESSTDVCLTFKTVAIVALKRALYRYTGNGRM